MTFKIAMYDSVLFVALKNRIHAIEGALKISSGVLWEKNDYVPFRQFKRPRSSDT